MFWLVPTPDVEKSSFPGFLRISLSSSAAVLNGESLRTKHMYGLSSMSEGIVNSFHLYCSLDSKAGRVACVAMRATGNGEPSGGAFFTGMEARAPEARLRFTGTSGGLLRDLEACCAA